MIEEATKCRVYTVIGFVFLVAVSCTPVKAFISRLLILFLMFIKIKVGRFFAAEEN